jgi:hypothetical protein
MPRKTESLSHLFSFLFCLIGFLVLCPGVLFAQRQDMEKIKGCISKMSERTAAIAAKDWEMLDRLSNEFLLLCKGVADPGDLSVAYENIAMANNQLERHKTALTAAESCIRAYYANPGCHIQKSYVLIAIGRQSEAWKSLEISERLALHALEGAKERLNNARSDFDRKEAATYIRLNEAQLNEIQSIRSWIK